MKEDKPTLYSRRKFLRTTSPMLAMMVSASKPGLADTSESDLYPVVQPGATLSFPSDHGAHPDYRTEWWYLTASLQSTNGPVGLQVTFFRSRTPYGRDNSSRFAPRQLVLAHAALALPERGKLLHDQQAFREQNNVARYSSDDTDVAIGLPNKRWTMQRTADDQYLINVDADEFQFTITAKPPSTMPSPVLQGDNGFARKGPKIEQASYYYSRPQLQVKGEYQLRESRVPVSGTGWLDHEWSSEYLAEGAAGWDWVGLNLVDGSALMATQMHTGSGDAVYSTARFIDIHDGQRRERNDSVQFSHLRYWQSPRTNANYPVSLRLQTNELDLIVEPLFDDQELDSSLSTGVIYWEGNVRVWETRHVQQDGTKTGEPVATGYLELTGYAGQLSL